LGGKINITKILEAKLLDTRSQVVNSMNRKSNWFTNVLPGHIWDLKANEKTIFGVAWTYDKENSSRPHTSFSASYNYLNLEFSHAADVGNFHAGYAGIYAGVPISAQRLFAGGGEKIKNGLNITDKEQRDNFFQNPIFGRPWGDRYPDNWWNEMGMSMAIYDKNAKKPILAPPPPIKIPISDKAYSKPVPVDKSILELNKK
jgi:hypothetical protein